MGSSLPDPLHPRKAKRAAGDKDYGGEGGGRRRRRGNPWRRGARACKIVIHGIHIHPSPPFCPMPKPPASVSSPSRFPLMWRLTSCGERREPSPTFWMLLLRWLRQVSGNVPGRCVEEAGQATAMAQRDGKPWPRAAAQAGGGSHGAHRQGPPRLWKTM